VQLYHGSTVCLQSGDGNFTFFLRVLHNVAQNSFCNDGRLCRFLHPVLFFDVSKKRTASVFKVNDSVQAATARGVNL